METTEYFDVVKNVLTNLPSSKTKNILVENIYKFHESNKAFPIDRYIADFEREFKFLIEIILEKNKTGQRDILEAIASKVGTIEKIMIILFALQIIGLVGYVLFYLMK